MWRARQPARARAAQLRTDQSRDAAFLMPHALEDLFHPKGVAIIGQVNRAHSEAQLRAQHDSRYGADNWSLVNPKGRAIGALTIYASVRDVPGPLDLAVITAPAEACPQLLLECGARGVRFAVVFSSGFSEIGPEGAALERTLAAAARRAGVRVLGPNTNNNLLERIPDPPGWRGGRIGVVTQSGHNGRPIVQGTALGIAFRRQVPCGNECDLEVSDFIDYFASDPETAVIAGYIEGFRDGAKLRRALAAAIAARKPVVMLKIGSTRGGARMAHSHTGHLAGADAVVDGLFAQHAVTRVRDLDELLDTAALFAKLPPGTGARVALYSISGGSGTLMAECAELAGVAVPRLTPETVAQLREYLPGYLTVDNPVDNGAVFITSNPPEVRQKVLDLIAGDPNVDLLVVGITGALSPMTDQLASDLEALAARGTAKPIAVTWNSPKIDEAGYEAIVRSGWPLFRNFRNCFAAIRHWEVYHARLQSWRVRRAPRARVPAPARRAIEGAAGVLSPLAGRLPPRRHERRAHCVSPSHSSSPRPISRTRPMRGSWCWTSRARARRSARPGSCCAARAARTRTRTSTACSCSAWPVPAWSCSSESRAIRSSVPRSRWASAASSRRCSATSPCARSRSIGATRARCWPHCAVRGSCAARAGARAWICARSNA
ncbi:MAG: hypothetical protein E6J87_17920 [Deltaproteobacteria bacterium]|nr:MAG: hypothetical protein E6J87_17920 [Deltaproteobacteria bacterium]